MSFRDCIQGGVTDGQISQQKADETLSLFDDLVEQYNRQMGPGPAQTKAAADAAQAARVEAIQRKRRTLLQAQSWKRLTMDMQGYRNGDPRQMGNAALAMLEQDVYSRYPSVSQIQQAITRRVTSQLDEFLTTFKRDILGRTRNKAKMKNLVRESFGENTGDAGARELASAWGRGAEYLRQRFNAAGGAIPKREKWGLPQTHSTERVRAVPYDEWRNYILPRLDPDRMIDERTGLKFTPDRLELALRDVYETIRTDGMSKVRPGGVRGGKSVAARRADHRFLVFKNADSWLQYNDRFGNPDPFDTMIGHIDMMARDIAMMERLGPNPSSTITFLQQTIRKAAAGDAAMENRANTKAVAIDDLYGALMGRNNSPVDTRVAYTMAGTRQLLQAAQLGSASLAAVTDLNFQRMTRQFNGLPQVGTISQTLRTLMQLPRGERAKMAIRLGLIADGYTTIAAAQMRFVGDMSGPEITRRISDAVMRASLLSPWTTAGRWSFGMQLLGSLADNVGKTFDQLDPKLRSALERYQIGADRWEMMRATDLYEYNGATFLRPDDIAARTDLDPRMADDLADKLLIMVNTETNFAVPSTSMRGRLALTGNVRPGTIAGEVTRSFAMYKNFPVTVLNTHVARSFSLNGVAAGGKYFGAFLVTATLMGALAMQLKEVAKGRDPINMNPIENPKFWGAAILQGGGLGIFGDFMFSQTNRFGGGLAETVSGPVVGLANDLRNLTIGNILQLVTGEDTNFGREMVNFAARYTPGSSLWYIRLGLERLVTDQVQMMVDPRAAERMRRLERRYARERGQEYWWRPGQSRPSRGPDFGAALGR
jgi:hypothetical protein